MITDAQIQLLKEQYPQLVLSLQKSFGLNWHEILPQAVITLMDLPKEQLSTYLNTLLEQDFSAYCKDCYWLIVAYSHPELTPEDLKKIAAHLGMSDKELLEQ